MSAAILERPTIGATTARSPRCSARKKNDEAADLEQGREEREGQGQEIVAARDAVER